MAAMDETGQSVLGVAYEEFEMQTDEPATGDEPTSPTAVERETIKRSELGAWGR